MTEYPGLFASSRVREQGLLCERGWEGLIREICEKLKETDVVFVQIKEKFGQLRIYVENGNEEIWRYLADSDGRYFTTCEECANEDGQEYK